MKTTQFIKRLFASAFTAVTLATLATVSLNQSAVAAVDEGLLVDMDPVDNDKEEISTISNGTITSTNSMNSAIYNSNGYIGTITNVEIILSEEETAYGIYNHIDASISSITDVDITISASTVAYGISNHYGTIGSITGATINVSSDSGDAFGFASLAIQGYTKAKLSGNITATTASGTAMALKLYGSISNGDFTFDFNGDTTLTASATDGGKAYALYADWANSFTLNADSYDTTIALNGDIMASSTALTLDSGNYVLSANSTVTTTILTINEGGCLTLTGDTTFDLTNSSLSINTSIDVSDTILKITEGSIITGLDEIDITLTDVLYDGLSGLTNKEDSSIEYDISSLNDIAVMNQSAADAIAAAEVTINFYDANGTLISFDSSTDTDPESIPEPSTATLSLLALAGLCVRRRRSRKA